MSTKLTVREFARRAHRNLVAFGYPDLTLDYCVEVAQWLKEGRQKSGIIALMMDEMREQGDVEIVEDESHD